jgi:hypothetical protein
MRHAVTVVEVPKDRRWVRISAWIHHPDAERDPVDVAVWCGRTQLVSDRLSDAKPRVAYARVTDGQPRVMIETSVDRTWRPNAGGDSRDLGLAISWEFVAMPKDDASRSAARVP